SLVHARWQDGVSAHQIVDVCHWPRKTNTAADALSCMFTQNPVDGDGSAWSVSEDLETREGIVNDLFTVDIDPSLSKLQTHFVDEPLLLEIVEALHNLDSNRSDRIR
ncbi:hypothetical protein PAXRUDRAFT_152166, partial [Paxillus rubicundulus Ve08.2h10]